MTINNLEYKIHMEDFITKIFAEVSFIKYFLTNEFASALLKIKSIKSKKQSRNKIIATFLIFQKHQLFILFFTRAKTTTELLM